MTTRNLFGAPSLESLLTAMSDATPLGIAFFDRAGRYLATNPGYAAMTGETADTQGGSRIDESRPALAAALLPVIERVCATGQREEFELSGIFNPHDADARYWTGICHPLTRNSRIEAVGAMIRDVTERRRAEHSQRDALAREQSSRQEAEQRRDFFRLVLENAPLGISVCEGPDHRLTLINDYSLRIVNMPRAAIIGRPLGETFSDAFRLVREAYDRVYQKGEVVTIPEVLVPLPDGRKIWAYACYAPIRRADGTPMGVMSLGLDISSLKQSQAMVASQKQVLQAIADGRPLSTILEQIIGVIADHSASAIPAIMLLDPDGLRLRHGAASSLLPDAYTRAIDGLPIGPTVVSCGSAAFHRQRVVVTDVQTDPRWADFRQIAAAHALRASWSTPIFGTTGQLLGTFAIYYREPKGPSPEELALVDLLVRTAAFAIEWCRADDQRKRLLEGERVARAEAEAANRSKDEFVATLSHELRTPLNAILGWTRMLRAGQIEPEAQAKALEAIERNTRAQSQLIEDLLDISRIVSGKLRLDVRSVELSTVVDAAVDSLRPAAEAKGIRVQTVIDPRAAPISGDPDRLQQVVWNLLSNAIKFTPKGGRVHVRLERINSHVEIIVSDTGVGIAADLLPHVFERFRQGDRTGAKTGGLGLGLAIARNLVELHGGSIDVTSDGPEQGATFRVKLPVVAAQFRRGPDDVHPTASEGMRTELPRLPALRILVVEDDDDGRQIVERILAGAGAEVRTAASATDARGVAGGWKPDVIISDIEMPEENGYSFISRFREQPGCSAREVPAIALTAYARVEDRIKALAAGFQMHVPKPVEPAELIAVIAAVAGGRVAS